MQSPPTERPRPPLAVSDEALPNQIGMMELAGEPIRAKLTAAPGNGLPFGGIKVIAENGWRLCKNADA